MPNPGGVNSFNRFAPEPAYGQVSQQDRMQKAYPIPGLPDVGKQAQRRAVKGGSAQQAPAPVAPPQGPVNPQLTVAQTWQQIAAIPGASDLVKWYATKAQSG